MTLTMMHNKNGTLNSYAFGCGCVEQYGVVDTPRATISREANGYHVKGFDSDDKHFWEVFEHVKDARAYAIKQAGKRRYGFDG